MAFSDYKYARISIIFAFLVITLMSANSILAPFFWSPSIDNIDTNLVTREADDLFSKCEEEGYVNTFSQVYIRIDPSISPYIYSLYARGRDNMHFGLFCSDVIHIPMWNDWWTFDAGLHVLREGGSFPFNEDRDMSNIDGRVYRWDNGGQSVWATY